MTLRDSTREITGGSKVRNRIEIVIDIVFAVIVLLGAGLFVLLLLGS